MTKLSLAFFTAAVVCAIGGMILGIMMGASENFTQMPTHAHLNLLGWASLALMGTFYALSGQNGRLGWINFAISVAAVVVLIPSLGVAMAKGGPPNPGVMVGSMLAVVGMLTFLASVLSGWKTAKA